jgi:phosphohistidine phosphatase
MKLYLVRHTTAVDSAASDAVRELTKEGRDEARVVGTALEALGVAPQALLSSPLVRARQTAEQIGAALGCGGEVILLSELENGPTTAALLRALKPHAAAHELVLVGHMPSLAEHMAEMLGARGAHGLEFGKGSVACLEFEHLRLGAGRLRWFMRQKQLRLVRA